MARLNELVVLCDDIALLESNEEESIKRIEFIYNKWCESVKATKIEKENFILLFKVSNAMLLNHIMNWYQEMILTKQ